MKQTLLSSLLAALLLLPATGAALHAQTAADTLRHRPTHGIGIDLRPGYVFPTAGFFRGDNAAQRPINTTLGVHLKYAFRFSPQSRLGRL